MKMKAKEINSARLIVELGASNQEIANAVMIDLSERFAGMTVEQIVRLLDSVRPAQKRAALLIPIDGAAPQPYELKAETTIGRSRKCDLPLPSSKVSRQHCRVIAAGSGFVIEDLASANRTWVNDEAIDHPRPLVHGDVIGVGDLRFEFRSKA